jgi:hypothetical protein
MSLSFLAHSYASNRYQIHVLTPPLTDPNAPKRGLSAYMFFANEQRDNVRNENPGIAFGTSNVFHVL